MSQFFAVYQVNGPILGVGNTKEAAQSEALNALEYSVDESFIVDKSTTSRQWEVPDGLCLRECSEELCATFRKLGVDMRYEVGENGVLRIGEPQQKCAYCAAMIPNARTDSPEFERCSLFHQNNCEWVATRGWTLSD